MTSNLSHCFQELLVSILTSSRRGQIRLLQYHLSFYWSYFCFSLSRFFHCHYSCYCLRKDLQLSQNLTLAYIILPLAVIISFLLPYLAYNYFRCYFLLSGFCAGWIFLEQMALVCLTLFLLAFMLEDCYRDLSLIHYYCCSLSVSFPMLWFLQYSYLFLLYYYFSF